MKKTFVLAALLLAAFPAIAQNTIVFTADTTTAIGQVEPVLTWDTIPAANDCIASGDWSGSKGGSGSETLATITASATYTLTCEWINDAATLSWTAPTQNTDGSALVNLAGYKLYYGQASGDYPNSADIANAAVTTYVVDSLSAGTWFFVATAYNDIDIESVFSGEATKIITGTEGGSEAVSITVNAQPNPPGGLTAT